MTLRKSIEVKCGHMVIKQRVIQSYSGSFRKSSTDGSMQISISGTDSKPLTCSIGQNATKWCHFSQPLGDVLGHIPVPLPLAWDFVVCKYSVVYVLNVCSLWLSFRDETRALCAAAHILAGVIT